MKFVEAAQRICIIALRRRGTGGTSVNARINCTLSSDDDGAALSRGMRARLIIQKQGARFETTHGFCWCERRRIRRRSRGVGSCCFAAGTRTGASSGGRYDVADVARIEAQLRLPGRFRQLFRAGGRLLRRSFNPRPHDQAVRACPTGMTSTVGA